MNEVDWARERKNPKFIPDKEQNQKWKITWKFSSRWYSLKITVNMTDSKNIKSITLKWLWIELDDPQEWFRTANLLNWIHNNAKKHPYWSDSTSWPWHLRYYQWSKWWDLERDVWVDMWLGGVDSPVDVDIVDGDTLRKHFYQIWKDQDFLDYINGYL
jgi:hypothetical protein